MSYNNRDCITPQKPCLNCPATGQPKINIENHSFGKSGTRTPSACCSKALTGGLMNYKGDKMSASSFTILKKSVTTVQPCPNNIPDNVLSYKMYGSSGNKTYGPTNTGGMGDSIKSVPIITSTLSGRKSRLMVQSHQIGVDVKHGSYARYLARLKGKGPLRTQQNTALTTQVAGPNGQNIAMANNVIGNKTKSFGIVANSSRAGSCLCLFP